MIEPRRVYKLVERRLSTLPELRRAVADYRADSGVARRPNGGGGRCYVSDPTAAAAIRELSPIRAVTIGVGKDRETVRNPERWIAVIDHVLQSRDATIRQALVMRYECGYSVIKTAMRCYAGERTVYDWLRDFVSDVALLAAAEKLV